MSQPDTYYDYEQDTEDEPYDDEVDYKVEKDPVSYDVLSNEYYWRLRDKSSDYFVRSGALFRVFYEAEIHERLRCKIPIVPLGRIFTYTIPDLSGDEGHSIHMKNALKFVIKTRT